MARISRHLPDDRLFDLVQERTFRWFWERAVPGTGMAPDRTTSPKDSATSGGTGFGIMAVIVAAERGWVSRREARDRIALIVRSLERAERHHGAWPHWLNARTGRTIPFGKLDDGGDLVETAFVVQGLIAAREYFSSDSKVERELRERIDALCHGVEWNWYKAADEDVLLWHWSPNVGFAMNFPIRGWNECLIVYVLAAGAPAHAISPNLYHRGWTAGPDFRNGSTEYGVTLPLGPKRGGPLFFTHYSFLGLDPHGLVDTYADYMEQNRSHVLLNYTYCVGDPLACAGYGPACWGLTASDNDKGYSAHSPTNDRCVIAPTAALSSFPYAPEAAMRAMRHFHDDLGDRIWTKWGFTDAFCESRNWYSQDHLAIDQGPIVVMMENHRSGLLWRLFMQAPEVRRGLARLGFASPAIA
jgi:hypothetical protein